MSRESANAVSLIFSVDSVDDLQNFYRDKLGFTRVMGLADEDGNLVGATMVLDGARLMFSRFRKNTDGTGPTMGKQPVEIYLEVADVEVYHARLQARSVRISTPLTLQWWGDRTFTVTDPNGYEIWFYQRIGEPKPPPGITIVQ